MKKEKNIFEQVEMNPQVNSSRLLLLVRYGLKYKPRHDEKDETADEAENISGFNCYI
jgi:hypothetical protein